MAWKLTGMAGGIVAGWTLATAGLTVVAFPAFVACLFVAVLLDEIGRPRQGKAVLSAVVATVAVTGVT